MQPSPTEELLLLTTLALESAIDRGDWSEWDVLVGRRDRLIQELECSSSEVNPRLMTQLSEANSRVMMKLQHETGLLLGQIKQVQVGSRSVRNTAQTEPGNSLGSF